MVSCLSVSYQGYEERVFEAEWSSDGEYRAEAAQQSSKQDEFANVRLHRQTGQVETQRCQILWTVQCILTLLQKPKENARLVIFSSQKGYTAVQKWKIKALESFKKQESCYRQIRVLLLPLFFIAF